MSKRLVQKLMEAISNDPKIASTQADFRSHSGNDLSYLETFLGLTQSDLKKLERMGHTLRAYTQNVWYPGDLLPNGQKFEAPLFQAPKIEYQEYLNEHGSTRRKRVITTETRPQYVMKGKGRRVKWIILSDGPFAENAERERLKSGPSPKSKEDGITSMTPGQSGAGDFALDANLRASTSSSSNATEESAAESSSLRST